MTDTAYLDDRDIRDDRVDAYDRVRMARPGRDAAAYRAAARHSRRVRFWRRLIPVGSVLAIAAVMFVGIFDPFGRLSGLTLGPVTMSGSKITMEQPKLTGFRSKDAQPYTVTAVSAAQDIKKPSIVELKQLTAKVKLASDNTANLVASTGIYDTQNEKLDLAGDVRVKTESGYEALLKTAKIDFKAGSVVSQESVRVNLTNGMIDADTLNIADSGKHIIFQGHVRTVFDQGMVGPQRGGAAKPAQK